MDIRIIIKCQTIREARVHLAMLSKQIEEEALRLKLDEMTGVLPDNIQLIDEDRYGKHWLTIRPVNPF